MNSTGCDIYEPDFVTFSGVASYLIKLSLDLTAQNYGYSRLKKLVVATRIVELKIYVRIILLRVCTC